MLGTYPIKIILMGGIFGFILITTTFEKIKNRLNKNDMYYNVKICLNEKSIYTKVMVDTGNFLKDPINKIPVMIIEKNVLTKIIPNYILENLEEIVYGKYLDLKEFLPKIRIIPYSSIGKENGIMVGVKVDNVTIEMEEKLIKIKNIIIGIYNGVLNKREEYHGLIGLELIQNENII